MSRALLTAATLLIAGLGDAPESRFSQHSLPAKSNRHTGVAKQRREAKKKLRKK